MNKTGIPLLSLLLATSLAVACSKSPPAPSSEPASENTAKIATRDPTTLPAEDFCEVYATEACNWQQRCSPSPKPEECKGQLLKNCDQLMGVSTLDAIKAGEISYDQKLAASWLNSLSQLPCESEDIVLAPEPLFRRAEVVGR